MANGSSNDSSISLMVIELFKLKGGLCQSKSIKRCKVYPSPIHCLYNVFTHLRRSASTGILNNCEQGAQDKILHQLLVIQPQRPQAASLKKELRNSGNELSK